jgi:hypothetical protein
MYHWEAAKIHNKCYGTTIVKGRRHGASWMAVGILLRDITQMKDALGGIMSKTGTDAKKFFKRKLVKAFRSLPKFLKPKTSSGDNPSTSLDFTIMSIRSKDSAKHKIEEDEVLDSYIEWRNTAENSFDSEKLYRFVYDEIGKVEERVDLVDQLDTILRTQFDNDMVIGKTFAPSTVNRMDKGGGQFKEVYYATAFEDAEDGETPNGLWGYFIPAYDGYSGTIDRFGRSITVVKKGEKYYTRFGKQITEGSIAKLERKRRLAKKKGESSYIEECRKMPFKVEEAFYFSDQEAVLDQRTLLAQMNHEESKVVPGARRGDMIWTDGPFSKVKFQINPNGAFLVKWVPPPNMQNKWLFKNGKKFPANQHMIRGGADPYAVDTALYGGSKGAFHLRTTRMAEGDVPKTQTILEYNHRPKLARIFTDDILKACVFYGASLLPEANIKNIKDYFENNGYGHYLIDRPKSTYGKTATRSTQKDKGIPTATKDVIMSHLEYCRIGIMEEMGETEEEGMRDFPFTDTIYQLQQYNLDNRTVLDLVISYGYAVWACNLPLKDVKHREASGVPLVKNYAKKSGGRKPPRTYNYRYRR